MKTMVPTIALFGIIVLFNNCGSHLRTQPADLTEQNIEQTTLNPNLLPTGGGTDRNLNEPNLAREPGVIVHVAQSGNDSNSGLQAELAVKTIGRAVAVAKELFREHSQIRIVLAGGYHHIDQTILIHNLNLSPSQNLVITSQTGQRAVITGARAQTKYSWTETQWRKGLFVASVPGENFRQIYSRSPSGALTKLTRARWPKAQWWNGSNMVAVKSYMENEMNIVLDAKSNALNYTVNTNQPGNGVEFHHPFRWMKNIFRLDYYFSTQDYSYIVSPMMPEKWTFFSLSAGQVSGFPYHNYGPDEAQFGWFENSPLYATEDLEWAFDNTNKALYLFGAKHSQNDLLIPNRLEQLLSIQNSQNISFENVVFAITDDLQTEKTGYVLQGWRFQKPNGQICYDKSSDCKYTWTGWEPYKSSAIDLGLTENIRFNNCDFFGFARDGISLGFGGINKKTLIENSRFQNIAGSAVTIVRGEDFTLKNNLFSSIAIEFGSPAVVANPVLGAVIENNSFFATAAYAILIFGKDTRDVHIRRNRVEYALLYQVDAGAINTSGVQSPKAVQIYENYILNTVKATYDGKGGGSPAIYIDEGSRQVWVFNNVIENASMGYLENGPQNHLVRGNVFSNVNKILSTAYAVDRVNHSYPAIAGKSESEVVSCTLASSCPSDSVFMENEDSISSAKAQSIIQSAGQK